MHGLNVTGKAIIYIHHMDTFTTTRNLLYGNNQVVLQSNVTLIRIQKTVTVEALTIDVVQVQQMLNPGLVVG